MSNRLVPEVRTDKTGRTQIRWVKPGTAPAGRRIPPAPSLGARGATGLLSPRAMRERREQVSPPNRRFVASDEEIWRVFAVASPSATLGLMANGAATPAKARKAVAGTEHAQDMADVAEDLISRGVPAGRSINWLRSVCSDGKIDALGSPWLADALEAYSTGYITDDGKDKSIPLGVLTGEYRLADLKTLGPKTFRSLGRDTVLARRALAGIASGATALTAEEVRQLAETLNPTGSKRRTDLLVTAIAISRQLGTATPILASEHPEETTSLLSYVGMEFLKEQPDRAKHAGQWLDEHLVTAPYTDMERSAAMFVTGLTPEGASRGMEEDVEPEVALAMENGIERGLSSGWI